MPPPHHGQSCAVKLMLENFGGDRRLRNGSGGPPGRFGIECYHVNARLPDAPENTRALGNARFGRVFFYCLEAIWCRFRYGANVFYYVPASGGASRFIATGW